MASADNRQFARVGRRYVLCGLCHGKVYMPMGGGRVLAGQCGQCTTTNYFFRETMGHVAKRNTATS